VSEVDFGLAVAFYALHLHLIFRLKSKHTGKYLAEEIAGCLERYGIGELVRYPKLVHIRGDLANLLC
jgi:hypothetical protein